MVRGMRRRLKLYRNSESRKGTRTRIDATDYDYFLVEGVQLTSGRRIQRSSWRLLDHSALLGLGIEWLDLGHQISNRFFELAKYVL
jgi:hypothetical protein